MSSFNAFRINQIDQKIVAGFERLELDQLTDGEVVIEVHWSGINYKDALAATGKGKILRRYPLNGGIDLSGRVVSSTDARYQAGDSVLVCGCGLSETADGGYAEMARVSADCVVPLPDGLSLREAMILGTAGFTAAMAVIRMEQNGQTPDLGPVVVTGATGGVGSMAIDMLSARGYAVTAFTGKSGQHDYLRAFGRDRFYRPASGRHGHAPAGARDLGRGGGQRRRRYAGLADAHRQAVGQYCQYRPGRRYQVEHHGDAVHPARRFAARGQFYRDAQYGARCGLAPSGG